MKMSIVALHGAPRSGTTWLGQLFNSHPEVAFRYQPFFSHRFRERINTKSSAKKIRVFFDDLWRTQDDFVLQVGEAALSKEPLQFKKGHPTHLVYKEVRFHHLLSTLLDRLPEVRGIGIIRDPRAVISSWSKAPREFDLAWDLEEEWRWAESKNRGLSENWYGFERWRELAEEFQRLEAERGSRFRIVAYRDLVEYTFEVIRDLLEFVGLQMSTQTKSFVLESTSRDDGDPYGVFRNKKELLGRWRRFLPPSISRRIEDEVAGSCLEKFLNE